MEVVQLDHSCSSVAWGHLGPWDFHLVAGPLDPLVVHIVESSLGRTFCRLVGDPSVAFPFLDGPVWNHLPCYLASRAVLEHLPVGH